MIEHNIDNDSVLRVAVIGSPEGILRIAESFEESSKYVCKLAIIEGWFGKNFWKCFRKLNLSNKLRLFLHAARSYHSVRRYMKTLHRIPKVYFNAKLMETRSLELIPTQEFDNIDIFIIACYGEVSSNVEYKTHDYVTMLLKAGISKQKIFCFPSMFTEAELPVIEGDELTPFCQNIKRLRPVMRYIEYHVTDFCNLKCKGCSHKSEYTERLEFEGAERFRFALERLSEKFENVEVIRLLGGEPLLCKTLHEYIDVAHDVFPYSQIKIVTNGLLYKNITSETISAIKRASVEIQVSQYPPTRKIANELVAFCKKHRLKLTISSPIRQFSKRVVENKNADFSSCWFSCVMKFCHFMRNSAIFPCPVIWARVDEHFKNIETDWVISDSEREKYSYDLAQDFEDDGWDILAKFDAPVELCSRCGDKEVFFDWESKSK